MSPGSRAPRVATLLALLALGSAPFASGGRKVSDTVWMRPDLAERRLVTIAIFPPAGTEYAGQVGLEDQWLVRVFKDGHVWTPSSVVFYYLVPRSDRPDALFSRLNDQIQRRGQLDSVSVRPLAKTLHADAILTIRVDRWERINESGEGMTSAHVAATFALSDSSGALLWKVSGAERQTAHYGIPGGIPGEGGATVKITGGNVSLGGGVVAPLVSVERPAGGSARPAGGPGSMGVGGGSRLPPDFQTAVDRLLGRWAPLFPVAAGAPQHAGAR